MRRCGLLGDEEALSDLTVRSAQGQELNYLAFPACESERAGFSRSRIIRCAPRVHADPRPHRQRSNRLGQRRRPEIDGPRVEFRQGGPGAARSLLQVPLGRPPSAVERDIGLTDSVECGSRGLPALRRLVSGRSGRLCIQQQQLAFRE